MRWTALVAAIAMLAGSIPRSAAACACCDGSSERAPIGWSASGEVLIEVTSTRGCERQHYLERWSGGHAAECFDLHGAPDRALACDALMADGEDDTGPSAAVRGFPLPARPLDPALVRAHLAHAPRGEDEAEDDLPPDRVVIVEVLTAAGFREVHREPVRTGAPEQFEGPTLEVAALPIRVSVWPSPSSDRAVVLIEGHDTAPGVGHWDTTVHAVALPALAPAPARERPIDHWSRIAFAPFSARPAPQLARSSARRSLRAALRGSREAALVHAADRDPSDAFARYHLARALMVDGQRARALALLDELRASGCASCAAVERTAAADPLFAPEAAP